MYSVLESALDTVVGESQKTRTYVPGKNANLTGETRFSGRARSLYIHA